MKRNITILKKYLRKSQSEGRKILFLTTSNRWEGSGEIAKSTMLANEIAKDLDNCQVLDVSKLKIFPCEGNVSRGEKNKCGIKEAILNDPGKNPHKIVRCWASINNPTDQMHTVANKIYESDIIIFFGSIRWGKMNSIYSTLMERLTWMEARHSSLGEANLLKNKEAGIIAIGHNWNVQSAVELEKDVLRFYGFKVPKELSFYRQWTTDSQDESLRGYRKDYFEFMKEFDIVKSIKEGLQNFSKWIEKI